jgi:DNA replication protein DnaC
MSKQCGSLEPQEIPGEYECPLCKDIGYRIVRQPVVDEHGNQKLNQYEKPEYVDVGLECECQELKKMRTRFKNALIPDEFKDASFKSFRQDSEIQRRMYNLMVDYLKNFNSIKDTNHNSFGFLATFGEMRLKELPPAERAQAKREHNSYGVGKTHLQIAAAKHLMKKVRYVENGMERGCRVLCISDAVYMEELIAAKRFGESNEDFRRRIDSTTYWADVLIWDDIGKSKYSEAKESLYYQIINERYRKNKPIIFSSNEDKGTLSEKIGYAAASRLYGMAEGYLLEVEGVDQRKGNTANVRAM